MRKESYLLISTLSVMLVLCGCTTPSATTPENKTSSETALEYLRTHHRHGATFLPGTTTKFRDSVKFPEAVSLMCSELNNFAGEQVKACITRSKNDGDWESIVIDLNGNADLTDDQPIALPSSRTNGTIVIERDGKAHVFNATMRHARHLGRLYLSPTDFLSGTTTFAGEEIAWAACDCNLSGALDAGDMVYLNRNGSQSETRENLIRLGPDALLVNDGEWYMVSGGDRSMVISSYDGATSMWTIDHSSIIQDKDASHTISFRLAENQARLIDVIPSAGLAVPSRLWRRIYGEIKTEPKNITYRMSQLDLSKDAVLKLEKPVAEISLSQRSDKISVGLKINAPHGVNYVMARTKPGPLVEIFSEKEPDKLISKGNMEYG